MHWESFQFLVNHTKEMCVSSFRSLFLHGQPYQMSKEPYCLNSNHGVFMYYVFIIQGAGRLFHCTDGIIISIIKGKVLCKLINILLNDSMAVVK